MAWTLDVVAWDALDQRRRDDLHRRADGMLRSSGGSGQVVLDERAPDLDATSLREVLDAATDGVPCVGTRPVTDTIKQLHDGRVVGTLDRDTLVQVVGPLVVPHDRVELEASLAATLASLAARTEVRPVTVTARRYADEGDLRVAELSAGAARRP